MFVALGGVLAVVAFFCISARHLGQRHWFLLPPSTMSKKQPFHFWVALDDFEGICQHQILIFPVIEAEREPRCFQRRKIAVAGLDQAPFRVLACSFVVPLHGNVDRRCNAALCGRHESFHRACRAFAGLGAERNAPKDSRPNRDGRAQTV